MRRIRQSRPTKRIASNLPSLARILLKSSSPSGKHLGSYPSTHTPCKSYSSEGFYFESLRNRARVSLSLCTVFPVAQAQITRSTMWPLQDSLPRHPLLNSHSLGPPVSFSPRTHTIRFQVPCTPTGYNSPERSQFKQFATRDGRSSRS